MYTSGLYPTQSVAEFNGLFRLVRGAVIEAGAAPVGSVLQDPIGTGLSVRFSQGFALSHRPLIPVLPDGHRAQSQGSPLLLTRG